MSNVTISQSALDSIIRNLEASAQSSRAAATGLRNASRGGGGGGGNQGGGNQGGRGGQQGRQGLAGRVTGAAGRGLGSTARGARNFGSSASFSDQFGPGFESRFFDQNEAASREFFNNYGRMISSIDDQHARLQKNTVRTFFQLSDELRKYSMDAGAVFQDLVRAAPDKLTALNLMAQSSSEKTAKAALNLLTVVGQFKEMGVSQEATLDLVDSATMAYEASAAQATSLLLNFRNMTKTLGIPTQKLVNDYRYMQKEMSYSLSEINDQFYKLEVQARSTGIPVEKLASTFGKQLDTFEQSAKAAGTLNALLGTSSINALELLNMKEGERIQYIKGAIKSAGVSLEQLTKGKGFGLKAIASAMGLSTEDTRRLLSGKSEEVFKSLEAPMNEGKIRMKLIESTDVLSQRIEVLGSEIVASMGPMNAFIMHMRRINDRGFDMQQDKPAMGRFEEAQSRLEKAFGEFRDPETGRIIQQTPERMMKWLDESQRPDISPQHRATLITGVIFAQQKMIDQVNKVLRDQGKTASSQALIAKLAKQLADKLGKLNEQGATGKAGEKDDEAKKQLIVTLDPNTKLEASIKGLPPGFADALIQMTNEWQKKEE